MTFVVVEDDFALARVGDGDEQIDALVEQEVGALRLRSDGDLRGGEGARDEEAHDEKAKRADGGQISHTRDGKANSSENKVEFTF